MPGSSGFLLLAAAGCYRGNRRLSDSFTLNSSSALNAKVRTPEQMFLFPSRPKDAGDATDLCPGKVLPTSSLFLPHTSLGHQVPQETDKGLQHPQVPSSCWFPTHSSPGWVNLWDLVKLQVPLSHYGARRVAKEMARLHSQSVWFSVSVVKSTIFAFEMSSQMILMKPLL